MEEEFYIGKGNKPNKKKHSISNIIKIAAIIVVFISILLMIGYKIYRRTLLTYDKYDSSILEEPTSNLNVSNDENYTLIALDVDEYFKEQVMGKRTLISLTDYPDDDSKEYDSLEITIYDDKTFLYTEFIMEGNKRKKINKAGKIEIDFDEFKKKLLNSKDVLKFMYVEDDVCVNFGLSYYDDECEYFVENYSNSFNDMKQYILSLNMNVEKENVVNGR